MRLLRDARGNALALMAAWLVPLLAFSGSAIDMGRFYTVKVRLQQACDAGALAGRKSMTNNTLDTSASGQAQTFFNNNFPSGLLSATNVSFTPSMTSDSQVAGSATATVPTTVMALFGQKSKTITVTCQARFDVADADIMFVLDTTGSMACTTSDDTGNGCNASVKSYTRPDGTTGYYDVEESGSKLSGLRAAVLSFYDTLAGAADSSSHIRYGFMPYTSAANVGSLLTSSWLVSKWNYQSRVQAGDLNVGSATSSTSTKVTQANCKASAGRNPATGYNTSGTAVITTFVSWSSGSNGTCKLSAQTVQVTWTYQQVAQDVSGFVAGNTVTDPTKITGATSKWQGCIEERPTTAGQSSFDQSNLPADLDPDLAPAASVDGNGVPTSKDTRWRPMWPDVIYYRGGKTDSNNPGTTTSPYGDLDTTKSSATDPYTNMIWSTNLAAGYSTCGKAATRLATMSRAQVSAYVNASDFKAIGGTYHDVGMIWGTRLISPTGLFASDTAAWANRPAPNRYIVFMTDGAMAPNVNIYGMYGIEAYDKRVVGTSYTAANDTAYHNARFVAECSAAKARNITVFVVGFGQTLNDQLKACASPGQAYYAKSNAALTTAFQQIAAQVASLRLSQ